jgi:hypothetical protein
MVRLYARLAEDNGVDLAEVELELERHDDELDGFDS